MSNPLVPRKLRFMSPRECSPASPFNLANLRGNAGLHTQIYCVVVLIIFRQAEKSALLYNDLFISLT